jgi:hypothetical protein
MNEPRTPVDVDTASPLQLRRRVKRGIVASYIHDLSERHRSPDAGVHDGAGEAVEQPEEA